MAAGWGAYMQAVEHQADDDRRHDDRIVATAHHWEREESPPAGADSTDEIDWAPSKSVTETSGEWDDCEVHGMRNQQPPQDSRGVCVDMHFEIRYREGDHQVVHGVFTKTQAHGGENATWVTL
jgi:hypothetical protein